MHYKSCHIEPVLVNVSYQWTPGHSNLEKPKFPCTSLLTGLLLPSISRSCALERLLLAIAKTVQEVSLLDNKKETYTVTATAPKL